MRLLVRLPMLTSQDLDRRGRKAGPYASRERSRPTSFVRMPDIEAS